MSQKIHNVKSLYLEGILEGNAQEAVEKYTGAQYVQHSTGVRDGKDGFVEFFEPFLARNPVRHIEIVRSFDDGQYVFVHAYQSLNNGESEWVTMDFFDTDQDDKIIEHWDVIAPYSGQTPSAHTQVDGSTEVVDTADTEHNKSIVKSMIQDLLMLGGSLGKASDYIDNDYIQHNIDLPDGLDAFLQQRKSPSSSLLYHDIVLLVGRGNFVATLCRVSKENQEYAQTDLYRIEADKIVEHWDAIEPLPADKDLLNGGKF